MRIITSAKLEAAEAAQHNVCYILLVKTKYMVSTDPNGGEIDYILWWVNGKITLQKSL